MTRTLRASSVRPHWAPLVLSFVFLGALDARAQAPAAPPPEAPPAEPPAPPSPPEQAAPPQAPPSAPPPAAEAPRSDAPPPPTASVAPSAAPPSSPAGEQPTQAPAPGSPPGADATLGVPAGDELRAVVVTAQRREETVQSVPTAVSVLDGEDLTDAGVGRSAKEILDHVPNASAVTQLHGRPRWWIRGVGTGQQQLDFSNPIGFYLDDVYISNATATGFPLFDLDRVEVLRGPQGTLWGKNTTGGAINVISRRPEFEYDGYLKLDYGAYEDKVLEGAFGGPIWQDKVAARGAFHYESQGGRYRNLYNGREDGQFQDAAGRLQLLARLSRSIEVLANVHVRKYTTTGNTWTVSGSGPGGEYLAGYVPSTSHDQINSNAPSLEDIRQDGALLNIRADLGGFTLTSISGYEDFHSTSFGESDHTPLEISRTWSRASSYQLSEEIRLASPREDRWNWIAGVYYLYEDIDREAASARLPGVEQATPGPSNYNYTTFNHQTQSLAAFLSSSLDVTKAFRVTAGLRWTLENRELDITRLANAEGAVTFENVGMWWEPALVSSPLTTTYDETLEKTWNNLTYDVTPQYQLTEDVLVYFRYAHGVKSGGFNTAATTRAALNVVEPEQLDNFELGVKTSFFNNRLTVNASAFHYIYSDIQINVVGPLPPTNTAVSYLQNVDKGRVDGAELEVDSLPIQNLHLGGSLGLLDTEFTEFRVLNGGPDYSGNSFVRSPHVTLLLRGDYRIPLPVTGTPSLVLASDLRYVSRQVHFTTNQDDPLLGTQPFTILNARVSFVTEDEKLVISGYANNVLDEQYRAHTLPAARDATGALVTWSDPLTVGASITTRWY